MIELPESVTLARQLTGAIRGKRVERAVAGKSPHRFAFFAEEPEHYDMLLRGKIAGETRSYGGYVEIELENMRLSFNDGVNLRFFAPGQPEPKKHQLYLVFDDGSALVGSVQMYGALTAFRAGTNDSPYYLAAREKVSPLEEGFDVDYFQALLGNVDRKKSSAKAFLATEQRIPGLGNGVLQDILWTARIHPKKKVGDFTGREIAELYMAVKNVLRDMAEKGGRDTEKDLYGKPGGYRTILSKNNTAMVCPECGGEIRKEAYLGGSIYYCPICQKI
ncbi:endonuclease VIII [Christensenella tenuis]|uniref:Endonuclease VIII n=1 Tax=Christensenella tenuis TaxID=2763033 RepID=A0ABR7EFI9_9FIRM|nr:endonuclease VIII [Christensenella tenuis]MBC5647884.1 endonuclease VIII [Christensenella tenuis]